MINKLLSISILFVASIFMLLHPMVLHHHDVLDASVPSKKITEIHKHHSHAEHIHGHSHSHKSTKESDEQNTEDDTAHHCHLSASHHNYFSQSNQNKTYELSPVAIETFIILFNFDITNNIDLKNDYNIEPPPKLSQDYIALTKPQRGPPTV